MTHIGDIIRARRAQLSLSQPELAQRVGVAERQIGRWENNSQSPSLTTAVTLARVLGISLSELAGEIPAGLDLGGQWFAAWQVTRDGKPAVVRDRLRAIHTGDYVALDGEDNYAWRGDLKVMGESLTGSYRAIEQGQRSRGSVYFALSPLGDAAVGGWAGLFGTGLVGTGWGALARDEYRTSVLLDNLIQSHGPVNAWNAKEEDNAAN